MTRKESLNTINLNEGPPTTGHSSITPREHSPNPRATEGEAFKIEGVQIREVVAQRRKEVHLVDGATEHMVKKVTIKGKISPKHKRNEFSKEWRLGTGGIAIETSICDSS